MNTYTKRTIDLEYHQIDLAFCHIRIHSPSVLKNLMTSIDSHGQIEPVVVVPGGSSSRFTLIDGYLRVRALKKLRHDIVKAEVWECSEMDALLSFLANLGHRKWESFEEAYVLKELQIRYQLSQEDIAKRIGKTHSWISRRLALLEMPEHLVKAVTEGSISTWSAYRVLVPVARATPIHAEHLLHYLQEHKHSTRELADFFEHYQKSNKSARENMAREPGLFFKAQKALYAEKRAHLLRSGPEGQWRSRLAAIRDQIKHLEKLAPQLFYERQEEAICQALLLPLERIKNDLSQILTTSRGQEHDRQNEAPDHYYAASIGQELPAH